MDQSVFEKVYRGRQGALHHTAYMRMGKVLLALRALAGVGLSLRGRSLFDYGFGAGTFFRYCPPEARLFGVEMDEENIREVKGMLEKRGLQADLQKIEIENWSEHPLLQRSYEVFLCSHVLEHLPDPVEFLTKVRSCITADGVFVGLVPLNELVANPHHVHAPNREMISSWVTAAGYRMLSYEENDPFIYRFQPLYAVDGGWKHKLAQAVSLGLGIPATILGQRAWFALGRVFAAFTRSKPSQAVFVAKRI